jgi:hypothetical protein
MANMHTTRRSFLHTLGIAAAGIAFRPVGGFLVPDNIVLYDGEPNLRWLLAESVAQLAAELPEKQFHHVPEPTRLTGTMISFSNMHQFGVHLRWKDDFLQRSKDEIREQYLRPAMCQMANEIRFLKPTTCFRLEMPRAVENCAAISAPKHGLDLRFIRAWNAGSPAYSHTNEETGELVTISAEPPGWIARFDMLVA